MVSLLLSWDLEKRKGGDNAPQLNKLPGPHGHPDVTTAKICLWQ